MLKKGFTKCVTFVLATAFLLASIAAPTLAGETEESEIDSQVQIDNTEAVEDNEESKAESSEISEENIENNSEISEENIADSNVVNDPEQNAESSVDSKEEETAGGESSESDIFDDAQVEESTVIEQESSSIDSSETESSQVESSEMESSQDESSEMESSQDESSEVESSQDESFEVEMSQVESSVTEESTEESSALKESMLEESQSEELNSTDEIQQIAEENMEAISLFSNANVRLLAMNAGISMASAGANDSNMGLAPGIQFYKFEIEYNKYPTNTIEYIVIHDTGNTKPGSDAMAHYNFFKEQDRDSSAHYFVDDHQVVQIIDDSEGSWHSGVKYKTPATPISNHNSIGIEMCINSDGDYNRAMKNTIDLTAYLMWKYDLDIDHVVRHYDANGKVCPLTMSENGWADWEEFVDAVVAKRNTYSGKYSGDEEAISDEGVHYSNAILGDSVLSAEAMAAYLTDANPNITKKYATKVAKAYLTISKYYGIRGDIAFFQAMLETGNLSYGGEVDVSYNNFCGMKAHGDTAEKYEYAKFSTVEEGVEAHLQHIYCYASTKPLPKGRKLLDPRFYDWLRGRSTTWEGLSGIWAQPGYDPNEYASLEEAQDKHGTYGDIIIRMYASAGGTNVQTGPAIRGSVGVVAEESYWDAPIYTGSAAGTRAVLKLGQTGSDVKEIQGYLKTIGYDYVKVTGSFDANTERAIKDIQKKNGLTSDGVAGEYTWTAVINTYVNVILEQMGKETYPNPGINNGDIASSDEIAGEKNESSGSMPENSESSKPNTNNSTSTGSGNSKPNTNNSTSTGSGNSKPNTNNSTSTGSGNSKPNTNNSTSTGSDNSKPNTNNSTSTGSGNSKPNTNNSTSTGSGNSKPNTNNSTSTGSGNSKPNTNNSTSTGSGNSKPNTNNSTSTGSGNSKPNTNNSTSTGNGNSKPNTNTNDTKPSEPKLPVISVSGRSMVYKGCSGKDVKALQQLLNRLGYDLAEDGIFGSGTDVAVRNFQKKNGLDVDGYVGPASWKLLGEKGNAGASSENSSSSGNGSTSGSSKNESNKGNSNGSNSGSNTSGTKISVSGRSMVSYGSSGADVKALQQLLNLLGYGLDADGIFGSGTNSAVRNFQSKHGLDVDGYVGSATWAALGKACGSSNTSNNTSGSTGNNTTGNGTSNNGTANNGTSSGTSSSETNVSTSGRPTVSYGDSGSNVKALQQLLNKHGYGLVEDGIFGGGTAAAVQKFQASQGLEADGIVGPLTWAKL